jgi:hypothetical protein
VSVPETSYAPAVRLPVVEICPPSVTERLEFGFVVTNITEPILFWTVIGPVVNFADDVVETVPVVEEVCTRFESEPDGATVRTYVQDPLSP